MRISDSNDEERLQKIFDIFIDFIPTPVRILIKSSKADKFAFRLILNMRSDLLKKVETYQLQITSSKDSEDEIKNLSASIETQIDQLPKGNSLNETSFKLEDWALMNGHPPDA